jgi:hypothetical protein
LPPRQTRECVHERLFSAQVVSHLLLRGLQALAWAWKFAHTAI